MGAGRVDIPAREGRAVRIPKGERFRVVNVEGGQAADLFAFNADDVSEYQSAEHTRVYARDGFGRLFPSVGEYFVTNRRRPILYFEEDHSPGMHDMLCAACDPSRYELLGVEGWHASCQENLQQSMAALGHEGIEIPQPINLFANFPVDSDGTITLRPSAAEAGDYVTMRAELDAVIVVSSCPQDQPSVPANGGTVKPLRICIL
jgi:uncharacterized protein YcgI (DUF1989 family)